MKFLDIPQAYLIRHGETELNASNCWRGWENPQLNEDGRKAGEILKNFFCYEQVGRVICSDLNRATETAEYVLSSGNVAIPYASPDPNLRSWAIGGFAGMKKTAANLKKFHYYVENPDEKIDSTDYYPGESLNDFRARNSRLLEYIATPHCGLPTVIVVHTSNITAIQRQIEELEDSNEEVTDIIAPGGVLAVYMSTDGKFELVPRLGEIKTESTPEAS